METKVEALEDNKVKVTVSIDAAEIDNRIKKTYKDFANKYNFPGFRKGKAPRPVIDNALGKEAVAATVTDDVVNDSYPLAIDSCDLYPVGKPDFDDPALVKGGEPYEFSFTVETKATCELSSYDPVEIELPAEGATEAELDQQIEALRDYYHSYEDAAANAKVKADGYVDLAIKATDDAGEAISSLETESRLYLMGAGLLPEGFDEQIVGLKKGEEKSFAIDAAEGKDSALMSAVSGKTDKVNFEVKVLAVKKEVIPELTDEWVKETLGFEDVADLRKHVADTIKEQKAEMLPRLKENACLAKLQERVSDEPSQAACEEAEAQLLQDFFGQLQRQGASFDAYLRQADITADQFKEDVKKQAADVAAQDMALDAWAAHFDLKASDEEVLEEFKKSGDKNPKALMEQWRKNGQLYLIRQGVSRAKAAVAVMDGAKVTEVDPAAKTAEKKKPAAKKAASKKTAAKAEDKAEEKPEKKPAAKKAAAKKAPAKSESETAEKKPAAKKAAAKKPAAKKAAPKAEKKAEGDAE